MDTSHEDPRTVEDVHGSDTESCIAYDLAHGGHKIKLTVKAEDVFAPHAWLVPSAARALARFLEEHAAEVGRRNLEEYSHEDGPQ
jgi:hypothetical protein